MYFYICEYFGGKCAHQRGISYFCGLWTRAPPVTTSGWREGQSLDTAGIQSFNVGIFRNSKREPCTPICTDEIYAALVHPWTGTASPRFARGATALQKCQRNTFAFGNAGCRASSKQPSPERLGLVLSSTLHFGQICCFLALSRACRVVGVMRSTAYRVGC